MTDGTETDDILDRAIERTRIAEARFVETPVGTQESVEIAKTVEQRAEDVEVLATEGLQPPNSDEQGREPTDQA